MITLTEMYYSFQPDGDFIGTPSVYVINDPTVSINKTYHADTLATEITSLLPNGQWDDIHLVLAGDYIVEWNPSYVELFHHPKLQELKHITFEVDGSKPMSIELKKLLLQWEVSTDTLSQDRNVNFAVSPSQSTNGTTHYSWVKPEVVYSFEDIGNTFLKFEVSTMSDIEEAIEISDIYRANEFSGEIYFVPLMDAHTNKAGILENCLKYGIRYGDKLTYLPKVKGTSL